MKSKPPASLIARDSPIANAMRVLSIECLDRSLEAPSYEAKLAFISVGSMLIGAANNARSPLLDALAARLPKSGGNATQRLNNDLAEALVALRMMRGYSKNKAISHVEALSGISRTQLARAFQGANRNDLEQAPAWKSINQTIAVAMFHNRLETGGNVTEWKDRIEEWLIAGVQAAIRTKYYGDAIVEELF